MVPLNPPAPEPSNVDPEALAVVRDGLTRHSRLVRHGDRRLRFPDRGRLRRRARPRRSSSRRLRASVAVYRRGGGYAPPRSPRRGLRRDRDGATRNGAAPAALKVFEHYFHKTRRRSATSTRLMAVTYTLTERSRAMTRRGLVQEARCSRVWTGSCSALSSCWSRTASGRSPESRSTMCRQP